MQHLLNRRFYNSGHYFCKARQFKGYQMYLDFLNMYVVNKAHALKKEQGILVEPAKNLFLYLW
jgi:hypothetical protein